MKKLILGLVLFGLFAVCNTVSASAATLTWDGGGTANNISDPLNWSGDVAPVDGDTITIDAETAGSVTVTNDTTVTFDTVNLASATTTLSGISIIGNELKISNTLNSSFGLSGSGQQAENAVSVNVNFGSTTYPIINTSGTNSGRLVISGQIISSGTLLTKNGAAVLMLSTASPSFASGLAVNAGTLRLNIDGANGASILGTSPGSTDITSGATLQLCGGDQAVETRTLSEDFAFTGGQIKTSSINYSDCSSVFSPFGTLVLSGDIAFNAATAIEGSSNWDKIRLTGALSGAYGASLVGSNTILDIAGSSNTSASQNAAVEPNVTSSTVNANGTYGSPYVERNQTLIFNSTTGTQNIEVLSGGTLKGVGTAIGVLVVNSGGHLAPGQSPGCLSSLGTTLAGSFDVELGGTTACTEYDQLSVTGAVDVTGGTLAISRYNNFEPSVGNSFAIINNDGNDAVTGTFSGLAEGATISLNGYTFTISYVGGDGNDVVLTVTAVAANAPTNAAQSTVAPGTPNTGFRLLMANPFITLLGTSLAAVGLIMMGRKYHLLVK